MATIRELFHTLGNKHNVVTVGCGATRETVEECLKVEAIPQEQKDKLLEIQKNLQQIVKEAIEADRITTEIHDRIYKIIDPDTGKIKG